jgi:hypothetical protein
MQRAFTGLFLAATLIVSTAGSLAAAPFDIFLDVAPTFVITPGPGFGIASGLGGRFYF